MDETSCSHVHDPTTEFLLIERLLYLMELFVILGDLLLQMSPLDDLALPPPLPIEDRSAALSGFKAKLREWYENMNASFPRFTLREGMDHGSLITFTNLIYMYY